jgi:hypothetical protein
MTRAIWPWTPPAGPVLPQLTGLNFLTVRRLGVYTGLPPVEPSEHNVVSIRIVGERRSHGCGRNYGRPVQSRVKSSGPNLRGDGKQENCRKNPGPRQVTKIHRHRNGIPGRFSQRGGRNLDDPEQQVDFGNLAESIRLVVVGFGKRQKNAPSDFYST